MPRIHLETYSLNEVPEPPYPKRTAIRFASVASDLPFFCPDPEEPLNRFATLLFPRREDMVRFVARMHGWTAFSSDWRKVLEWKKDKEPEKKREPKEKIYSLKFLRAEKHTPAHPRRTAYRPSETGRKVIFEVYANAWAMKRALKEDERLSPWKTKPFRAALRAELETIL